MIPQHTYTRTRPRSVTQSRWHAEDFGNKAESVNGNASQRG